MKIRGQQLIAALAFAGAQLGCGGMITDAVTQAKDAATQATPDMVSGAVAGLARPETQRDILAIASESHVKALTSNLSAGVVDAALDTLEDPARSKRIEDMSNRLVESALATLDTPEHRARLEAMVRGIAGSAVGAAVDTTFSHALNDKTQVQMRFAMRTAVSELVGVVFESVRSEMGTSEEQGKALGAVTHEVVKGATLGFQDALDETKRQRASGETPKSDGALLIAMGEAGVTGSRLVWLMAVGLSIIALVLALSLVWAIRKNRARRAELEQRDEALLLLTEAIKSTETEPWANELRTALNKSIRDGRGGEHVRKIFYDKTGIRLGVPATS